MLSAGADSTNLCLTEHFLVSYWYKYYIFVYTGARLEKTQAITKEKKGEYI